MFFVVDQCKYDPGAFLPTQNIKNIMEKLNQTRKIRQRQLETIRQNTRKIQEILENHISTAIPV